MSCAACRLAEPVIRAFLEFREVDVLRDPQWARAHDAVNDAWAAYSAARDAVGARCAGDAPLCRCTGALVAAIRADVIESYPEHPLEERPFRTLTLEEKRERRAHQSARDEHSQRTRRGLERAVAVYEALRAALEDARGALGTDE